MDDSDEDEPAAATQQQPSQQFAAGANIKIPFFVKKNYFLKFSIVSL